MIAPGIEAICEVDFNYQPLSRKYYKGFSKEKQSLNTAQVVLISPRDIARNF